MSYQFLSHTADLRLRIEGPTFVKVFEDALLGMTAVQKQHLPPLSHTIERFVEIRASDPTALLIDFLNEVLALSVIHKQVYPKAVFDELTENSLKAKLQGIPIQELDEDIKAVTYHEANMIKNILGNWEITLVLDI